ncbi:class I SAM-dependent methyltransferase [Mycobacterium sp.]|uniref:class I SAM-dependent methyltransferase n=1 Tax=Mycobacterium sp. TaxID=1785 RepID=UPI003D6AE909
MTDEDRIRWDKTYTRQGPASVNPGDPPVVFAPYRDVFPASGRALDLACGQGLGAVWLARRGLDVWGLDVSLVAIGGARDLAHRAGVDDRCRFDVIDLDDGLPPGPPVDVILCHKFRDRRLDRAIIDRLSVGAVLAVSALSEVGGSPGPFRAGPGELLAAFAGLAVIAAGEGDGEAWLVARAGTRVTPGPGNTNT